MQKKINKYFIYIYFLYKNGIKKILEERVAFRL